MKKFAAILLAVAVMAAFASCTGNPQLLDKVINGGETPSSSAQNQPSSTPPAASGDNGENPSTPSKTPAEGALVDEDGREYDGYAYGDMGDTLYCAWFGFSVDQVEKQDSYLGYTAQQGNTLVVTTITVENTFDEAITMFYDDFMMYWNNGEGEEDGYAYPLEPYADELMSEQYQLGKGKTTTGKLVFEVPQETSQYCISFLEVYEDDFTGNLYEIYFDIA